MAEAFLPVNRRIYTEPPEAGRARDILSAAAREAERFRFAAALAEFLRPVESPPAPSTFVALPPSLVALHSDAGGSPVPQTNPLAPIETLGQLNAVLLFNVGHFTGDTFLLKSAVAAMRRPTEDDNPHVQPAQDIDGDVSGKK